MKINVNCSREKHYENSSIGHGKICEIHQLFAKKNQIFLPDTRKKNENFINMSLEKTVKFTYQSREKNVKFVKKVARRN